MAEPYLKRFKFNSPNGELDVTSVVLDEADFYTLIDELTTRPLSGMTPEQWDKAIASLRQARHIPLVKRGTKTEWMFHKFGVESDHLSAIVRGEGRRLAKDLLGMGPPVGLN